MRSLIKSVTAPAVPCCMQLVLAPHAQRAVQECNMPGSGDEDDDYENQIAKDVQEAIKRGQEGLQSLTSRLPGGWFKLVQEAAVQPSGG